MTIKIMTPNEAEWEYAWSELANHKMNGGDRACECPHSLERWQYMNTDTQKGIHIFRHRCHPSTLSRKYLEIRVKNGGDYDTD